MGTFDIAVGPLVELWQTCGKLNRLPTAEEFARVKPLLGAGRIILDPAGRTIRFPVAGMRLDLGGLKGFIADEVTKLLVRRGVKSALVAMAGDIHALGRNLGGGPWRVGVQDPRNPEGIVATLDLADRSVSTSGNYERFVEIQGRRYSHIVDPRTGRTAESVPSVTVIAPRHRHLGHPLQTAEHPGSPGWPGAAREVPPSRGAVHHLRRKWPDAPDPQPGLRRVRGEAIMFFVAK